MNQAHSIQFLSAWFRNPRQAGALLPSGSSLAQAMAAQVDPGRGLVVELGAGTGAITRALIARGVTPEQLTLVEKDPALFGEIQRRFPGVVVLRGDAAHLGRLLNRAGAGRPGTLVSSLPLLSMTRWQRLRVLIQMFSSLGVGGVVVQFTYSPLPPIPEVLGTALGVTGTRVARVFSNLPPAAVWVYRVCHPRSTVGKRKTLKCPACEDANLAITERQVLEIEDCPQCRALWLDRGELDKLNRPAVFGAR